MEKQDIVIVIFTFVFLFFLNKMKSKKQKQVIKPVFVSKKKEIKKNSKLAVEKKTYSSQPVKTLDYYSIQPKKKNSSAAGLFLKDKKSLRKAFIIQEILNKPYE